MKKITENEPLRQRGPQPKFSDSELVAMLALADISGIDADKHALRGNPVLRNRPRHTKKR